MFIPVNVKKRRLKIKIGDKEGLLQSYLIYSIKTNLHLIYGIDSITCF